MRVVSLSRAVQITSDLRALNWGQSVSSLAASSDGRGIAADQTAACPLQVLSPASLVVALNGRDAPPFVALEGPREGDLRQVHSRSKSR